MRLILWPMCYLEICCLISKYFGICPAVFLLLIYSLISVWSESILCLISILLNLLKNLMAQNVVFHSECSMWAGQKCLFCYCWMKSVWSSCAVQFKLSLTIFCLIDLSVADRGGTEVSNFSSAGLVVFRISHFSL